MSRILVIGDQHIPAEHPSYLRFCKDMYKKHSCRKVVMIGDIVDWHAVSFHQKNPEAPGTLDEYKETLKTVQKWYKAFPKAKVCIGNHCSRIIRLAETVNIPELFLKTYNELWKTPGWDWEFEHIVDDIYFTHGTGTSGIHPAWNMAGKMLMSVCMGHCHSRAGIKFRVNPMKRIFSIDVGCGVDRHAIQMKYGEHYKEKPILSCAVILDGIPYLEIMPCGENEKYHRSKK